MLSRDRIFTTDDKVNNDRDEVPDSSLQHYQILALKMKVY